MRSKTEVAVFMPIRHRRYCEGGARRRRCRGGARAAPPHPGSTVLVNHSLDGAGGHLRRQLEVDEVVSGDGVDYPDWLRSRIPGALVGTTPATTHYPHLADPAWFMGRLVAFDDARVR